MSISKGFSRLFCLSAHVFFFATTADASVSVEVNALGSYGDASYDYAGGELVVAVGLVDRIELGAFGRVAGVAYTHTATVGGRLGFTVWQRDEMRLHLRGEGGYVRTLDGRYEGGTGELAFLFSFAPITDRLELTFGVAAATTLLTSNRAIEGQVGPPGFIGGLARIALAVRLAGPCWFQISADGGPVLAMQWFSDVAVDNRIINEYQKSFSAIVRGKAGLLLRF